LPPSATRRSLGLTQTSSFEKRDRLAWLRAWTTAEPRFLQAQKLFVARGDNRNALYAEVSAFRGSLPRMAVPTASARLAEYLEHPLVQSDDRLRLRVLVIKGETDEAEAWLHGCKVSSKQSVLGVRGHQLLVATPSTKLVRINTGGPGNREIMRSSGTLLENPHGTTSAHQS
jgi:hypothetical protein